MGAEIALLDTSASRPFGGPVVKVGAEIALFAKRGKYQGALGPFLSVRGPSGPFINSFQTFWGHNIDFEV